MRSRDFARWAWRSSGSAWSTSCAVRSTAFTFGTVLFPLPARFGRRKPRRRPTRPPRIRQPLRAFLSAQCALVALAALSLGLLAWLPGRGPPLLGWYVRYWTGEIPPVSLGSSEDLAGVVRLYVLLPLFLFGMPTFPHGLELPHPAARGAGRRRGLWKTGGAAPGREHRRLRRGQPADRARGAEPGGNHGGRAADPLVRGRLRGHRPPALRPPLSVPLCGGDPASPRPGRSPARGGSGFGFTGRQPMRPHFWRRTRPVWG